MKVSESGWYRTRGGGLAEVVVGPKICGYIVGTDTCPLVWSEDGEGESLSSKIDLVDYLGKERPKQKKTVKMAPALCKVRGEGFFLIGDTLYSSAEQAAEEECDEFVRWLVDTPYEISVEVDE